MPNQNPLAEVFGYPISNNTPEIISHRDHKLCPFNNITAICSKNSVKDPLGVCSVIAGDKSVITCPVRFREDWKFVQDAADFFFPKDAKYLLLNEIPLKDAEGKELGNCDYVLARIDELYNIIDFGLIEVQAVYISGNVTNPFKEYMKTQDSNFQWPTNLGYPKPDWLSSSLKRLVPQIIMKGRVFHGWKKKLAVVLQKSFYATLPVIPTCDIGQAEIAWQLYDLVYDEATQKNKLTLVETRYSMFDSTLEVLGKPKSGEIGLFVKVLEQKMRKKGKN